MQQFERSNAKRARTNSTISSQRSILSSDESDDLGLIPAFHQSSLYQPSRSWRKMNTRITRRVDEEAQERTLQQPLSRIENTGPTFHFVDVTFVDNVSEFDIMILFILHGNSE